MFLTDLWKHQMMQMRPELYWLCYASLGISYVCDTNFQIEAATEHVPDISFSIYEFSFTFEITNNCNVTLYTLFGLY